MKGLPSWLPSSWIWTMLGCLSRAHDLRLAEEARQGVVVGPQNHFQRQPDA